jgi:hypothetical protein
MTRLVLFAAFFVFVNSLTASGRAVLIHNSIKDIDACKGKLKLELVRVWGGDEEEDESKFFKTPGDVAVDEKNDLVYICDEHAHCIKVFKHSGEYVRTIGQKGKGPGDIYTPTIIALFSNGDLIVNEYFGCRIQYFSSEGKSKYILKTGNIGLQWIGLTSKNQMIAYNRDDTFKSKKLVSIRDEEGNILKRIGTYHDKSGSRVGSEMLRFAVDESDNIYGAYLDTPLLLKYSPDDQLLLAITFTPPFKIPKVKISLNSRKTEIKRKDSEDSEAVVEVKRTNKSAIMVTSSKKKRIFNAMDVDSKQRIFVVTPKRLETEKEFKARRGAITPEGVIRSDMDFEITKNTDINRLLVFSPEGRVVAETQLTGMCERIRISGNHIFIIDGIHNQRILEYKMIFEK